LHQNGPLASGGLSCQNILDTIAHHHRLREVDAVAVPGGENQPRPGLRQLQSSSGRWGQIENVRDPATAVGDGLTQPAVHRLQRRQGNHLAVDDRLVGDDDDRTAAAAEAGDGIQTARDKVKLRPALDVIGGVHVNDAVAVDENGGIADG
jgi:hypothetical protein